MERVPTIEDIAPILALVLELRAFYQGYTQQELAREFAALVKCPLSVAQMWVDFTCYWLERVMQKQEQK